MWFSACFATWYHLFSRLTSQFLQLISICANLNHPHCHVYRLAILIMLNDSKWRKQTKSEKHVYTFFILSVALYLWCICWRSISLINKLIWTYFPWAFLFIYLYHHHASSFSLSCGWFITDHSKSKHQSLKKQNKFFFVKTKIKTKYSKLNKKRQLTNKIRIKNWTQNYKILYMRMYKI